MRRFLLVTAAFFGILGNPALPSARAAMVSAGWDLFQTAPGTTFTGVPFQGVPLGTFNFGGAIGVKNVGNADTIIQRVSAVSSPTGTTGLVMDALQLESSVPANLGAGVGFYFITLQSARGGPTSTGTMTINFSPNTFSSSLDVFYDVRFGSLSGPIVFSNDSVLTTTGDTWQHPPTGLQIDGVNHNLNGTDNTTDFWPGTPFSDTSTVLTDVVQDPPPAVPEPSTLALTGIGGALGCAVVGWRRRKLA
jgi:hypothetical protein